jgi:exodeoxyribonuclease VII small subunit
VEASYTSRCGIFSDAGLVDRAGLGRASLTMEKSREVAVSPELRSDSGSDEQLSFEQILEKLEAVVGALEQGDAPLELALSTFERGVVLARLGTRRLDEAERRIEVLLSDEQGLRTRPLERLVDKESQDE